MQSKLGATTKVEKGLFAGFVFLFILFLLFLEISVTPKNFAEDQTEENPETMLRAEL